MTEKSPVLILVEFNENIPFPDPGVIQRHPDLNGKKYNKHPYYLAQFKIHPNDINNP